MVGRVESAGAHCQNHGTIGAISAISLPFWRSFESNDAACPYFCHLVVWIEAPRKRQDAWSDWLSSSARFQWQFI